MSSKQRISRRDIGQSGAAALLASLLVPHMAMADEASVAAEIRRLYGSKPMASGKIRLEIPDTAENGLVVPINVEVDSPMTEADHVRAVHVFADGNPLPGIVTYRFSPACGKAAAATRMRLAQTQNIICIAEMSNGALHMVKQRITVSIGGCG